jgi:hypothetical protein
MPLAPLVLDDLDWAQLVQAARQRIPALSGGQWTLHAPVDPGITLVELFAWLLDQRMYWMDQVDAPLFRAAVALLGEDLEPVRAAHAVMALARDSAQRIISEGTTLEIARAEAGPVFATRDTIALLDVARLGLQVIGADGISVDREYDLREQRGVELFAAGGEAGAARIVLYLTAPPPAAATSWSLFFDVAAPAGVAPEWHPDAADVPPPAAVTWWYSRGPGAAPGRFAREDVDDGTGGLRRAGLVRLPLPDDWAPEGPAVDGVLPFAVWLRTAAATFTFPPTVWRIVPNAAIAAHRRRVRRRQRIVDWLPLPARAIALDEEASPAMPDTTRLRMREVDGRWHAWRPVRDFARCGPADRVFHLDRERRWITFGDGLTGRMPRPDPAVAATGSNVAILVTVGGGPDGNIGPAVGFAGTDAGDVRASTLAAAAGGRDAESLEQARSRISGLIDRVQRAVTADDHVALAVSTPGVAIARAHAAVGFHPAHPCRLVPGAITVFVVPWAPRGVPFDASRVVAAPVPDPGALEAVRDRLDRTRMVGTEVWVCPPRYRTVRLAVRAVGDPTDVVSARRDIDAALRQFLDPLVGGDDRNGWPFGGALRPSVLMRQLVPVVEGGTVESVAIGLDGDPPAQDCTEIVLGAHDLPRLDEVAVRFEMPRDGSRGGLR